MQLLLIASIALFVIGGFLSLFFSLFVRLPLRIFLGMIKNPVGFLLVGAAVFMFFLCNSPMRI